MCNGPELLLQHLPQRVRDFTAQPRIHTPSHPTVSVPAGVPTAPAAHAPAVVPTEENGFSLADSRASQERMLIERALAAANNCRSQAARALKVSRVTLYNKMRKYGLDAGRTDEAMETAV